MTTITNQQETLSVDSAAAWVTVALLVAIMMAVSVFT